MSLLQKESSHFARLDATPALRDTAHPLPRPRGRRGALRVEQLIRERLRGIDGMQAQTDVAVEDRPVQQAFPGRACPDPSHAPALLRIGHAPLRIGHAPLRSDHALLRSDHALLSRSARGHCQGSVIPLHLQGGAIHCIEGIALPPMRSGLHPSAHDGCGRPCGSTRGITDQWLVPFACIEHVLCAMLDEANPGWSGLLARGVVWIGDRVHPSWMQSCSRDRGPGGPREMPHDARQHRHGVVRSVSLFVRDGLARDLSGEHEAEHDAKHEAKYERNRVATGKTLSHETRPSRTFRDELRRRMHSRVWAAEQALRMHAAGVVVLDGTGLDLLCWRRLQLSVAQAGEMHAGRTDALAVKPIVLVACPPSARPACGWTRQTGYEGSEASVVQVEASQVEASQVEDRQVEDRGAGRWRGCTAMTRWSVHPRCVDGELQCDDIDGVSNAFTMPPSGGAFGFSWRMQLDFARSSASVVSLRSSSDSVETGLVGSGLESAVMRTMSHASALIESSGLHVDIHRPRSEPECAGWDALSRLRAVEQDPDHQMAGGGVVHAIEETSSGTQDERRPGRAA